MKLLILNMEFLNIKVHKFIIPLSTVILQCNPLQRLKLAQLRQPTNSISKFSTQCLIIEVPGGSLFGELSFETFTHTVILLADAVSNTAYLNTTVLAVFWGFLEVGSLISSHQLHKQLCRMGNIHELMCNFTVCCATFMDCQQDASKTTPITFKPMSTLEILVLYSALH